MIATLVLQNALIMLVFGAEHAGENVMPQEPVPDDISTMQFDWNLIVLKNYNLQNEDVSKNMIRKRMMNFF